MRVSYNDYKLYLSILDSVSKQLNKAIKSEVNSNVAELLPDHEFDGEFRGHVLGSFTALYADTFICSMKNVVFYFVKL